MLGNPKFKVNDKVKFKMIVDGFEEVMEGYVYIVDAYGTFFQTEQPSYDIMVERFLGKKENALLKHIPEDCIIYTLE